MYQGRHMKTIKIFIYFKYLVHILNNYLPFLGKIKEEDKRKKQKIVFIDFLSVKNL
jgi:hypothetical protein